MKASVARADARGRRINTKSKNRIVPINLPFETFKLPLNDLKLRFDHIA